MIMSCRLRSVKNAQISIWLQAIRIKIKSGSQGETWQSSLRELNANLWFRGYSISFNPEIRKKQLTVSKLQNKRIVGLKFTSFRCFPNTGQPLQNMKESTYYSPRICTVGCFVSTLVMIFSMIPASEITKVYRMIPSYSFPYILFFPQAP